MLNSISMGPTKGVEEGEVSRLRDSLLHRGCQVARPQETALQRGSVALEKAFMPSTEYRVPHKSDQPSQETCCTRQTWMAGRPAKHSPLQATLPSDSVFLTCRVETGRSLP